MLNQKMSRVLQSIVCIIDNTPDCSMPERRYSESRPSLHSYLEELMEYRDMHKKRLLQGKKPKHMSEKDDDLLEYAFESRWYCFPTPFKRGDIVYDCRFDPHDRDFCKGTFVLDGIDNNDNENGRQNRDSSDMTAYGWFQEADGTVYSEVMFNYMDLELFRGQLEGQERLQIALSNYIKGNISEELLLYAQRTLIMQDLGYDSPVNTVNRYTEEGLELAGVAGPLKNKTGKKNCKNSV